MRYAETPAAVSRPRTISASVRPATSMLRRRTGSFTPCTVCSASWIASRWASAAFWSSVPSMSKSSSTARLPRERRLRAERLRECGDEPRAGVDVVELDHLHRGVHVAQGDGHAAGRHARARKMDGVGVGAGRARRGLQGERDPFALGRLLEQLVDRGVEDRAAFDDRTRAELVLADLVDLDAGSARLVR